MSKNARRFIMISVHSFDSIPKYCYISTYTGAGTTSRKVSYDYAMAELQRLEQLGKLRHEINSWPNIRFETWTLWHTH